ncbi:SAF domain-containing protein [Gordonia jinhuaensis]|nr:SAF domain-containing protein [Gordonia jinhuaensis]
MRLSATLLDRIRRVGLPGAARTIAARRAVAIVLVIVGAVTAIAAHRDPRESLVAVAAHDLRPGQVIAADDVVMRGVSPDLAVRSLTTAELAIGSTTTGAIEAGEVLTTTRLLRSRQAQELTGHDDARLVPVRLADAPVATLLRVGDVVDVVSDSSDTSDSAGTAPTPVDPENNSADLIGATNAAPVDVLASGAVVAVVADRQTSSARTSSTAPILLAMPAEEAHRVAAAGLNSALTVVLR